MANYNKVLLWAPNDAINIPQFPEYASGTNAGAGSDIDDAAAQFKTGPYKVNVGDVVMTYNALNFPVEIVQVTEVSSDNKLICTGAVTNGLVYRVYRSNGGSANLKEGYDGYNFRISTLVDPAVNHDLNVIAAGQSVETVLSLAWTGVPGGTGTNNPAYEDIKVTRILATNSPDVVYVTVLGEANN